MKHISILTLLLTFLLTYNQVQASPSDKAEQLVKSHEEVTKVVSYENDKHVLVAFRVKQFQKFFKKRIEKDIKKEIEEEFSDKDVLVSTDLKIFIEIERLNRLIEEEDVDEKKIEKQIKKITKLSKEQT
ncbi:hypothetical protein EJF36_06365 [Bacillus sp. HMF5848]|uniref:YhcN/YlaJ family sporulation lipoprotein n=1 Tax=Bacillus sp. HMF5848 TaxID=2495421 RepID=UPI000F78D0E8|nr:YhcN/YlaJ family sporulation lipoprotein [Bacillus sp. HMF5848]RSK26513.1 hypothetical protein EJF36_06365 [Bacillus sp. HMF5848]